MEKAIKSFLSFLVALIIVVGIIIIVISVGKEEETYPTRPITFSKDRERRVMTVYSVDKSVEGLVWENVSMFGGGSADLPTGTIDVGDVIVNCSGEIYLYFIPTEQIIKYVYFGPFTVSYGNRVITVTSINENVEGLVWENVTFCDEEYGNFSADLPTGTIDVGDVITNCSREMCLIWKPTSKTIALKYFPE